MTTRTTKFLEQAEREEAQALDEIARGAKDMIERLALAFDQDGKLIDKHRLLVVASDADTLHHYVEIYRRKRDTRAALELLLKTVELDARHPVPDGQA
jgi:hypothetical protein